MGTSGGIFQAERVEPLVAFDFDGTLTWRDSFTAFLRWRAGSARYALGVARLAPSVGAYLFDRDRGRLKIAAAREFLGGTPVDDLRSSADAFAEVAAAALLRPDALRCWDAWLARGARIAIVTASPEAVVAPFARRLGADALIGTRLAIDAAGNVTGAFDGANCRGAEKVTRLRERFGPGVTLAAAYGDTAGDREMLEIAEEPGYRVFTERA
jgi:phosphatidylglycerophosphatase C